MRSFSLFVAALCTLGVAGLLGACQRSGTSDVGRTEHGVLQFGSVEAVDTVARSVAPNERPLILEGMQGAVHLTGASQTTADLSFVRRGRGESPEAARSVLEEISITERGTQTSYTFTLAAERKENYAAVDVRGRVPRRAPIQIDRMSGPVRVDDVEGALTISHDHGSVDLEGVAGPVDVDIHNGDVQVRFRAIPNEGPLQLHTFNGDLRIGLPTGASVQVNARTSVGVLRTSGVSPTEERLTSVHAGVRYEAQVGAGGPSLELRTENGTITLQRADTTRTSSPRAPARDTMGLPSPDTVVTPPTTSPDTVPSRDTTGEASARDTTDGG